MKVVKRTRKTVSLLDKLCNLLILISMGAIIGAAVYRFIDRPADGTINTRSFIRLGSEDQEKLEEIIDRITDPGMNRVEKIKAVHDWMVRHIQYDHTYEQHDASETLNEGIAVCTGYSALFYNFMQTMGIPCVEQRGDVFTSPDPDSGHAWNAVQLENGVWYFMDVCWDDSTVDGSSDYPDGRNVKYTYFLCGRSTIEEDRIADWLPEGTVSDTDYAWEDQISTSRWIRSGAHWTYCREGLCLKHQWLQYKGKWYYLDSDGYMVTGWQWIGGQYYYFLLDGAMAADETLYFDNIPYVFDRDGNFVKIN